VTEVNERRAIMMHIVVEVMLWYDDRESLHYSIASMINVSVASDASGETNYGR
jgi:hypothetical protein